MPKDAAYDAGQFDSPGVEIALAREKAKQVVAALDAATQRGVVIDREVIERWYREIGDMLGLMVRADDTRDNANLSNALASLKDELEGFLAE